MKVRTVGVVALIVFSCVILVPCSSQAFSLQNVTALWNVRYSRTVQNRVEHARNDYGSPVERNG